MRARCGPGGKSRPSPCTTRRTLTPLPSSSNPAPQWITEEVDGKKTYLGQLYANGENCPGFGNRQTKVLFQCKETAKEMELVKEEEPVPCQYVLHVAYAGWCEVKPE